MMMRNMLQKRLIVASFCLAMMGLQLVGCVVGEPHHTTLEPCSPVRTLPDDNYQRDLQSRQRARDEERLNREHNLSLDKKNKDTIEQCYDACLDENELRKIKWEQLQRMRETIRHLCHTTGTKFQGRSDLIETDEQRTASAHPRIVEDNGHLEYRERRVDVVEIHPKWICPNESSDEMKETSMKWMYDTPPELS